MEIRRISLLGHKDHGKSSLIGSLLMLTKSIPETRIQEARKASRELGVKFEPAYLLDTFSDERSGGMTFDNTRAQILYENVGFELIDVPGHEELIKSMLSGTSNSDFSLVVVSTRKEEGITDQTKRHIYVSKLLGTSKYIVALNKMDASGFDQSVYNSVKEELTLFFHSIGIQDGMFSTVPISAYTGDNIVTKSENMPWYKGKTLLDVLKTNTTFLPEIGDEADRIILQSSIKFRDNTALLGEVLTGHFSRIDSISIFPGNTDLEIIELRKGNEPVVEVKKGDSVALITRNGNIGDVRGLVVVKDPSSVHVSDDLNLRLFFLENPKQDLIMYLNNVRIPIAGFLVQKVIDPISGSGMKSIATGSFSILDVKIKLSEPIVCETFHSCRELGRVVLTSDSKLIAAGIIISVNT